MQLELNREEIELLRGLVERELEGINPEIHHSATAQKREELRDQRSALRRLLQRIAHSGAQSAAVNA